MQELGLESLTLKDGSAVKVKQLVQASIPVRHRETAFQWLRDRGHGDLIKNQISAEFGKGEDQSAGKFIDNIKSLGYEPKQKVWVEPMTLKAFVREQIAEGVDIPMETFGIFVGAETKISKKVKGETMANTNVAKKAEAKLPALSLDMMESDAHSGLENIQQDDLATPRLKILMQLSPELEELENAKAGMIYNTVTNELYDGSKGIRVLPCAYQRQYVEWADRGQGSGAPINVYDASSDILTKTTRDENNKDRLENGNYVETCGNHYVLLVGENGDSTPALITMKATQLKKSRKWNSMLLNLKINGKNGLFTPPSYSHFYRLKTSKEGNDKGSWYGWEISREEQLGDANLYSIAKTFAESVSKGEVKVKYEEESTNDQKVPF